jgi:FkbM family methyltransferase
MFISCISNPISEPSWNYRPTERTSISMEDFIASIKLYIDTSESLTIIDAGSLNGNDAEILQKAFPNSKAYAIEGLTDNYEAYIKDKTTITGIHRVVASYDGEIIFHQKESNGIHGIYDRGQEYGTHTNTYRCSTMKTIMEEFYIPIIDIIKIDLEGATYDALISLGSNINNIKIMHIETETHSFFKGQRLHNDVCSYLHDNNFHLVDITFVEISKDCYQSDSVWVNKKFSKVIV